MAKKSKSNRLVRITGNMLGTWSQKSKEAKQIEAESLICVDISANDNYPNAPSLVVHPKHGKCWYIDSEFCQYEYLDDDQEPVSDSAERTHENNHSAR
tara:strand:+ start:53 stop:346 length:294 start_codon:yes stop_codon:yes gene_type:complete